MGTLFSIASVLKLVWVTVGDAFSDLPEVFPTADSKYKLVSLNIEYPYKTEAQNEYQKLMRTWYGKEGFGVSANAFRRNTRDFPIFERMQQGDNYIAATKITKNRHLYSTEKLIKLAGNSIVVDVLEAIFRQIMDINGKILGERK